MIRSIASALALTLSLSAHAEMGFFSPDGIDPAFANKVDVSQVSVRNEEALKRNLANAKAGNMKVYLDFGSMLNGSKTDKEISRNYVVDGKTHRKTLAPLDKNKLRKAPTGDQAAKLISGFMPIMTQYKDTISAILVADEPYINGISKAQLEDISRAVRPILDQNGLGNVRMGVIFASGMENAQFAKRINESAGRFVKSIDDYHKLLKDKGDTATADEKQWLETIAKNRLSTYDAAGNFYMGGGIPKGYDLVGYDFYFSTVMQDALYDDLLPFMSKYAGPGLCNISDDGTIKSLKPKLSFYQDGPVIQDHLDANGVMIKPRAVDKAIIDRLYLCRMTAGINMLREEIVNSKNPNTKIVLITESSNNGVLEFSSNQAPETDQPVKLIEQRVLDEVNRGLAFYRDQKMNRDIESLLFFTYADTVDTSIHLNVGGVSNMPTALSAIYSATKEDRANQ